MVVMEVSCTDALQLQVRTQAFGQRMRLIMQVRTKLCGH